MIKVRKLVPSAQLPVYATNGAGCFDLATTHGGLVQPGCARKFGTGLAFEVPNGFVMLLLSRSGHGFKHGVRLSNCVGAADSDYRGEVMVSLHNDGDRVLEVAAGERIAQAIVIPAPQWKFVEVDELGETARGVGGFGSTGLGAAPQAPSQEVAK